MEVRPGYKSTEIGVIPQDWDARTIDEIALVTSGKRLPLGSSLVRNPTPHPYIRVTDMRPGTVDLSEIRYVPESVFPAIKRYRIFSEDLFISVAGSLGIVGKVPEELDGANLTENADRITSITCSQDFLLHVLMSPLIQGVIDSIQTVGAQPKLALTRIRKFVVPQPPLPEQRAIAAALSDMDALLAGLDRLITKKRDLKRAAMQQLLTGQTRLPGFQGKWAATTFGQVAQPRRDRIDPRSAGKQDFCIELEHIAPASGELLGSTSAGEQSSLKSVFSVGDVLFGKLRAYLRKHWLATCNGVCSTEIWVLTPKSQLMTAEFLFQLVKTDDFIEAASNSYGTHMPRSDWGIVKNLEIALPSLLEQAAIAAVLSDMDAELTALEARRDKTRALKQGMMQELLTGRTRLV
jgi:type I restriction enzyme, S subunit